MPSILTSDTKGGATFFQGRYRSILVEDEAYVKRLIRYVHLNPVEANVVNRPDQFRWSSYRSYLGHDYYVWLTIDRVLNKFSESKQTALEMLVTYTHKKMDEISDSDIILKGFRKGSFAIKDSCFMDESIKHKSNIQDSNKIALHELISLLCTRLNVTLEDLLGQSKTKEIVAARSILSYITKKTKNLSLESLATQLGKNSGTLSRLAEKTKKTPELLLAAEKICLEFSE